MRRRVCAAVINILYKFHREDQNIICLIIMLYASVNN